jgi:hypothetical protein
MPLWFGDRKAHRHQSEKTCAAEIIANMELQFIAADAQRLAGDQRRIGAAIGVGRILRQQAARACPHLIGREPNAHGGPAGDEIEHMGGEPAIGLRFAGAMSIATNRSPVISAISSSAAVRSAGASLPSLHSNCRRIESRVCRRTQMMKGKPKRAR